MRNIRFILVSLLIMQSSSLLAQEDDCGHVLFGKGPCLDCPVGFSSLNDLNDAPPLLWDLCKVRSLSNQIIHFFPSTISVVSRGGRKLQKLSLGADDSIRLNALLNYHPWGRQSEVDAAAVIVALKNQYPNIKLKGVIPLEYELSLSGSWQEWVASYTIAPINAIDVFSNIRLNVQFLPEFHNKVKLALKRDLGILGNVIFIYKAYRRNGEVIDLHHSLPLFLGNLILE